MTRTAGPDRQTQALVERYGLAREAYDSFGALLALVADDPLAPTTVRDRARAVDDHLADSLVALELADVRRASRIVDVGAGAGFPGLPLAVALPTSDVALVESNARKCAFIKRARAVCGATNAVVVNARVEEWASGEWASGEWAGEEWASGEWAGGEWAGEGARGVDVVTVRAVSSLAVVAEYAAPLLRLGGVVVAWRGRREPGAEQAAARAGAELGLRLDEPLMVKPYPGAEHRHLHVMRKVAPTPDRFPRRPGVAAKRPLGAQNV